MGIVFGNSFEHGLRVCHFVALNNLAAAYVRLCRVGEPGLSDHLYLYRDLGAALLRVAANIQLDCAQALTFATVSPFPIAGSAGKKADYSLS